jgi:hypothetical protein
VLRPIRTAITVVMFAGLLWAAFAVRLGDKTFAEHVDTISDTPEAKQLIDDTRATLNPALAELRDRLLGEYVEAPTWIADDAEINASTLSPPVNRTPNSIAEPTAADSGGHEPPLPGRPARGVEAAPVEAPAEPPLPGRRR